MNAGKLIAAMVGMALLATACGAADLAGSLIDSPGPGFAEVSRGAEPIDLDAAAEWPFPTSVVAGNKGMLSDAGYVRGYERAWTRERQATETPTIKRTGSEPPTWLLVRIRVLQLRDDRTAGTLLDAARRDDEKDDPESTFAVPGLAHGYGSSYSGRNGANVVRIVYVQGENLAIVQVGSTQQWIGIQEAIGYAKQQYAAGTGGRRTTLLVLLGFAAIALLSVGGLLIVRRRRRAGLPGASSDPEPPPPTVSPASS